MIVRNAKHTFYAGWVPDADLDMGFVKETRPLVNLAALRQENSPDGIKGLKRRLGGFSNLMKVIYYRAIRLSQQCVRTAAISWHRLSSLFDNLNEIVMGRLHRSDASRGCQVEAVPQIKNRSNNKRLTYLAAFLLLLSELKSPQGIGLPKIDASQSHSGSL